jgi:hypothetical protein
LIRELRKEAYEVKDFFQARARVRVLEYGLHSIPSCGLIWQAVVTAHFRYFSTRMNDTT